MAKKIIALIKLALKAGKATTSQPVGPALGKYGLNIALFVKEYNAKTGDKKDTIIPVEISVYQDKTFSFILKTPPASVLLKEAANIKLGSSKPNLFKVGTVTKNNLEQIAHIKMPDLNTKDLQKAIFIIRGTALSLGLNVIDD